MSGAESTTDYVEQPFVDDEMTGSIVLKSLFGNGESQKGQLLHLQLHYIFANFMNKAEQNRILVGVKLLKQLT